MLTVSRDRIHQAQVPVEELGANVVLSKSDLKTVIEQFQSPTFSKPDPAVPGVAPAEVPAAETKQLSIEVFNASDIEGAAALTSQLLQQKGCAKATIGGNITSAAAENQVYFSDGNQQAAEDLATLLKPSQVSPIPADFASKAQLVVVLGNSFTGALTEKKAAVVAPLTFENDPEEGRMRWQAAKLQLPFPVQKPMSFPAEFTYQDFHVYEIDTEEGAKPALKVVGASETGQAWGIMETTYTDAPLLQQPSTERDINGKTYRFFYVDDKLRYLAWQDGDVVFWITNSLQNTLTEETMVQLAVSFKPV